MAIFNEKSEEAIGIILKAEHQNVEVSIDSVHKHKQTKKFSITLACAIPKKAKFELIIEKCTELGVDEIIPLITQRTEVRFDAQRAGKKANRYKTVAINTAKQCGRSTIPVIHAITNFKDAINNISAEDGNIAFIPCLNEKKKKITDVFPIKKSYGQIIFFIGPEGDFTPTELSLAIKAGCIPLTLGKTVLKVDTAAISVISFANLYS